MLKKRLKKYLCFLSAVVIAFSSYCFNVSAAQSESNTYKLSMGRPSTGSSTGYAEVLLEGANGDRFVRVFAWNIYSTAYLFNEDGPLYEDFEYNEVPMLVNVTPQSIRFEFAYNYNFQTFGLDATILSFSSGQSYNYVTLKNFGDNYVYSSSGYTIKSVHLYGNYKANESVDTTEFYVLYSDEVVQYNQMLKIIQLISQLSSSDSTVSSKLDSIINNTDTIESKLQSAINLLTTIETDLDEVNKELDRIESNTDDLENKLDTIISILNDENLDTPKPDTSVTDDYTSKEEALIDGTSSGREEVSNIFDDVASDLLESDSSDDTSSDENSSEDESSDKPSLGKGLLAVTNIFNEFLSIEWILILLKFSLALGFFGFILGMSFFIISHSSSRESRSKKGSKNRSRDDKSG